MWYKYALDDAKRNIILPGSSPIKPDYFRAWSGVAGDLDSIREHGLSLDFARGHKYGEPDLIWGSTGGWDDRNQSYRLRPTVEFQISPEILKNAHTPWRSPGFDYEKFFSKPGTIALRDSIPPEDIIEIYEPWMDDVLYLLDNPDAFYYVEDLIKSGESDMYIDAYNFIKRHME